MSSFLKILAGLLIVLFTFLKSVKAYHESKEIDYRSSFSFLGESFEACFFNAASYYGVNPELLIAIAYTESRLNPRAVNKNKNKSYDLGIMQINTSWIPYLKKYGVDPRYVWDPCYNVYLGAMVLRYCMDVFGNTWRAVDCYNKGSKKAKSYSTYVMRVYNALSRLSSNIYGNKLLNK